MKPPAESLDRACGPVRVHPAGAKPGAAAPGRGDA